MKYFAILCLAASVALAAEKSLALKDLPAAVQKTVREQTQGAETKSISKEIEHGVVQYEVESMLNGKHHDLEVDTKGNLLVVEDETTLDAIPAPARAAILKKVADGSLRMVETFKRGGETMYEAAYTTKAGRKHEVLVKADGTETKD
jgi:hypothetical protein